MMNIASPDQFRRRASLAAHLVVSVAILSASQNEVTTDSAPAFPALTSITTLVPVE